MKVEAAFRVYHQFNYWMKHKLKIRKKFHLHEQFRCGMNKKKQNPMLVIIFPLSSLLSNEVVCHWIEFVDKTNSSLAVWLLFSVCRVDYLQYRLSVCRCKRGTRTISIELDRMNLLNWFEMRLPNPWSTFRSLLVFYQFCPGSKHIWEMFAPNQYEL